MSTRGRRATSAAPRRHTSGLTSGAAALHPGWATQGVELGIKVDMLEDDQRLQEAVLSVHHACVQTVVEAPAFKIIENRNGVAFISAAAVGNS